MTQMRRLCSLTINKRLAVVDCNLHEYAVLRRLVDDPEVPQHDLAYDAAIDPAAVSRLVRDMSRNGLVTTQVDPTDKRQRFVKITTKGRSLERTLSPVVDSALQPLMTGLSIAEEQQFLHLLRKAYEHAVTTDAEQQASESRASSRVREDVDTRSPTGEPRDTPRESSVRPKKSPRRRAV